MEFDCTKEGKNIYFACREKIINLIQLLMVFRWMILK